jgi:hypothetical protein
LSLLVAVAEEEEITRNLMLAAVEVLVVIEQVTPLAAVFLLQKHLVEEAPLNQYFLYLQIPVTQ